jgi:hypothetical protein
MHLFLLPARVRLAGRALRRCAHHARRAPDYRHAGALPLALLTLLGAGAPPASAHEQSIGTGESPWAFPLNTQAFAARCQTIYLATEVGTRGSILALDLDVSRAPSRALDHWTIRMAHTEQSIVPPDPGGGKPRPWMDGDWVQVYYRESEPAGTTGWRRFVFDEPFAYDGTRNLLVEFSLSSPQRVLAGLCRSSLPSTTEETRSLMSQVVVSGNPLPAPGPADERPNVRLLVGPHVGGASPATVKNDAPATITVSGTHIHAGATLKLTRPEGRITATNVSVTEDHQITGTFNLTGAPLGFYGVLITNPDGLSDEQPGRLVVEDGGVPLAAAVGRLRATRAPSGKVTVEWTPEEGSDVAGYHVLRAARLEGPFTRVTPRLIPPGSRTCRFVDGGARGRAGQYYCLEVRHTSGRVQRLAPVSVSAPAASSRGKRGK